MEALDIVGKEHPQPSGGRIDFLMRSDEDMDGGPVYYEVEVMLGALDESHIIRTIEYWDLERQRRPQFEHRAVIVAEKINSRFFNVLRQLNRSVPLIAVHLSAFVIDNCLVLHPIKVLDVIEEVTEDDASRSEPADRAYWVERSKPGALAMADRTISMVETDGSKPRPTYNQDHIAVGTTGYNFCWLRPAKAKDYCTFDMRCGKGTRDSVVTELENAGIHAKPSGDDYLRFSLFANEFDQRVPAITAVLRNAETGSRS